MSTRTNSKSVTNRRSHKSSNPASIVWVMIGMMVLSLMVVFASMRQDTGVGSTPDFTASTLSGDTVHLSSYRGQVVMLNFWATWCPPCRAEMPSIEAAYERYQSQGFIVLALNNGESAQQISPFASMLGLRFPVVLDTDMHLQSAFAIQGYPTSLFIGRDGQVYATHSGGLTPSQLTQYIETGLAQPAPNT
ncbi:MAG: TlpA disulfide reductase family protein [Anaerolineae bacterium]